MESEVIKVLIVDDSPVSQDLLSFIIESDSHLKVIGIARNVEETFEFLEREKPDVITMDIVMPKMDGFEVTRKILKQWQIPIIIVSDYYNRQDVNKCFQAMDAGALAILEKPKGFSDPNHSDMARSITETIKVMSQMKVSQASKNKNNAISERAKVSDENKITDDDINSLIALNGPYTNIDAICIGASIGGPHALQVILSALPANFPIPIYIVQHISGGFIHGLVDWLNACSPLKVLLARNGQSALPGNVYVAPHNFHMEISSPHHISLVDGSKDPGVKPSIGRLFHSIAEVHGSHALGLLLTGMGSDGVADLLYMKKKGALTIAQDEKSCVLFNKPSEAIQLGAVKIILPLDKIAYALEKIVSLHQTKQKGAAV